MIMAYITEPFRISAIVTYLHFFIFKGNWKEIFIVGFLCFCRNFKQAFMGLKNRKEHERQHNHFKTRFHKSHEMLMLTASSRVQICNLNPNTL